MKPTTTIDLKLRRDESFPLNSSQFSDTVLIRDDDSETKYYVGKALRSDLMLDLIRIDDTLPFWRNLWDRQGFPVNWTDHFQLYASLLSTIVQSPANVNATNITASAYGDVIFVEIRWIWMAMPLSIVFISIMFFVLTIFESSKRPYVFKTSIIAVLFHGLEGWDVSGSQFSGGRESVTDRELVYRAKMMTAAFKRNEEGSLKLRRE